MKYILFLSADDFKEKSIQVIRKTPEAYVKDGWKVFYIVLRDSSTKGNYYYEKPLSISGVNIVRKEIPFTKLLNGIDNAVLSSVLIRIRKYIAIFYLVVLGIRHLKEHNFDVLYGYEQPGSVAAKIIKLFYNLGKTKLILRFQGVVFVKEWVKRNVWYRGLLNFDTFYALKGPSDLCIMTNDGSCGDWVLEQINAKHKRLAFWPNGVDRFIINQDERVELLRRFKLDNEFLFISVSRLDDHKRVDRCIHFFKNLVVNNPLKKFRYLIVGEGAKRVEFEKLVYDLKIEQYVNFIGALNQSDVPVYLDIADAFVSMYESSNVGNPLLEAIRLNKLIITLDNGATNEWIKHKINGFLYPVDDQLDFSNEDYKTMANDFLVSLGNPLEISKIKENLRKLENEKLWSWEDRFDAEIKLVNEIGT